MKIKNSVTKIVFIVILFSGCSLFHEYEWMVPEEINTIEDAQNIMKTIEYKQSSEWQLPAETYFFKSGDCDCLSGLFASMLKNNLGYEDVKLVGCIFRPNGKRHMVVLADGDYYQGEQGHLIKNFDEYYFITNILTYDEYIFLAKIK